MYTAIGELNSELLAGSDGLHGAYGTAGIVSDECKTPLQNALIAERG